MPLRRGELPTDDLSAIWARRSALDLARRMEALAAELEGQRHSHLRLAAPLIREVLLADRNPLPDRTPELGDPPRRATSLPRAPQMLTLPPPLAEHVARRTQDPGE